MKIKIEDCCCDKFKHEFETNHIAIINDHFQFNLKNYRHSGMSINTIKFCPWCGENVILEG